MNLKVLVCLVLSIVLLTGFAVFQGDAAAGQTAAGKGVQVAEKADAAAAVKASWAPRDLLPGLWLLVLAFLLDRTLRRFYDSVPGRIWGIFAAALIVLLGGVLFGGQTLLPVGDIQHFPPYRELGLEQLDENRMQRDLTHAITPWQAQVRRAYSAGEWPLWNPSTGAGVPLLANPQAMPFAPLVLAALPLALPAALGTVAALRILIAFVFTFLLLRRQGISEPPAVVGALAFGLGGFMILFLGWPHANSTALLPVVLYATARWSDELRGKDLALLTLSLFSTFATGHPETALYVLMVGGVFALARIRAAAGRRWPVFRGWAVAAVLGGLMAAPLLLPAADFLPKSNRYEDMMRRKAEYTSQWLLPHRWKDNLESADERLMPAVTPNAWGNNLWGDYWGYHNINEAAGGFAGTLTLFAAFLAFLPGIRRRFPQERFMIALVLVGGVILLRPPLYLELIIRLPPFDKSPTFHGRFVMVLSFAFAYLAACTLERFRRDDLPWKRVALMAAALAGLVLWGYLAHPNPDDPSSLEQLRHLSLGIQLASLALGVGLLLGGRRFRPGAATVPIWIVAGLVAAELFFFHGAVNTPAPRSHFYPASPPLTFIQAGLGENVDGHRMLGLHAALPPEFATIYDLEDPRGLGPSLPVWFSRLVDPLRGRPGSFLFNKPNHPILDLLGVRYLLAEERWKYRSSSLEKVFQDPNGVVWERSKALARLFLPWSIVLLEEGTPWWDWTAANRSFERRALTLPTPGHENDWRATRPRASSLEIEALTAAHIRARADLVEERFLASGIYQDGGWRLLVDGERRSTTLANGPLVAAWLPAGEHRIDWIYRPPGFLPGMLLAALAGAGFLVVTVQPPGSGPREERREEQAEP